MNLTQLLRKTSPYIILVIAAFAVMGVVSYYSVNKVMQARTDENINYIFRGVEDHLSGGLALADVHLVNAYHVIRRMLDRGAGQDAVIRHLMDTSSWVQQDLNGAPGVLGIYGYINGVFMRGVDFSPAADWVAEERPWYRAARNLRDGEAACTSPYIDVWTGRPVISLVRNCFGLDGRYYGVLVLDMDLAAFSRRYGQPVGIRGYGMVINQEGIVMCHPDESQLGRRLDELNSDYAMIANLLKPGGTLWNRNITDLDGSAARVFFRPILDGWYAALVRPADSIYSDIYNIEMNPAFIGLIIILLFSIVLLRINASQIRSDEISAYKSAFLAQMSHEVRTPMNTVLGMSELALQERNISRVMDYVEGIKRAAHSLLSIINDILDISRIEKGALEIRPVTYYFSSLLNDAISMIRAQVAEKPIIFTANVDAWIPNVLVGDESRVKQILIGLLSNAVKYTREGFISLDIQGNLRDRRTVQLTIKVSDSGVGIRREDLRILFENFVRLDLEKNQGIEGAGLGLVITRNLCRAMGGDVAVQSDYGKGSVFTATLFQKFEEDEGLARVENAQSTRVLCYEERDIYAASIMRTLESLGVPARRCTEREEFFRELDRGGYQFAFVTANMVEETADRIKTGFLPTNPVLLGNPGEMVSSRGIPLLTMPAYATPIANVLNNRSAFDQRRQIPVRFIAPDARVLVVDDIVTNVKVAEGLLSLYQPVVDTCLDGRSAVELVRKHHYDLVFLDHMMPGMDGIETASAIRALREERFLSLPLVALTANAIFGMREMFLEHGFNDYLAKPIEIGKLDEIMARWIPRDKQVRVESRKDAGGAGGPQAGDGGGPEAGRGAFEMPPLDTRGSVSIAGLDIAEGMNLTGSSTWAMYCDVLALYCSDISERLGYLQPGIREEALSEFCTQVHALKGASASIGAAALAQQAADLEAAGKSGDLAAVEERLGPFLREAEAMAERIRAALAGT